MVNAKTSQYTWNSAPIDDTDIPRCVAAIGREFRFPLDVELLEQPSLNKVNNSDLFHYLYNVQKRFKKYLSHLVLSRKNRHNVIRA